MKKTLPALTGIRFFLAIYVVLFHFSPAFAEMPRAVRNFIGSGYVAVPMFFVLSGFVLAYGLGRSGTVEIFDRRRFWIARFARIYPLYLAAFLLMACLALVSRAGGGETPSIFDPTAGIAQILAVHTWVPEWSLTWNLPSWSIGVEFFFYFTFPFFAPRLLASASPRRLLTIAAVLWIAGTSIPVAYVIQDPDGLGLLGSAGTEKAFLQGTWLKTIKFNPIFHLPTFVIGIVTAGIFLHDVRSGRQRNALAWTMIPSAILLVTLTQSSYIPYPLLHNTTLAPLFAGVILGLAHGRTSVATLLSKRPFVALGNASYAIYILQFPVAVPIFAANKELMTLPRIGLYLALLTSLGLLSERFLERPCRKILSRRLTRRTRGPEVLSEASSGASAPL